MISQRDIVLLTFPFSDLRGSKVLPALVLSNDGYNARFEDIIAVPMTSNLKVREHSILVRNSDLETGKLVVDSKVKVDRIFSVSKKLVRIKIGRIRRQIHEEVIRIKLEIIK